MTLRGANYTASYAVPLVEEESKVQRALLLFLQPPSQQCQSQDQPQVCQLFLIWSPFPQHEILAIGQMAGTGPVPAFLPSPLLLCLGAQHIFP